MDSNNKRLIRLKEWIRYTVHHHFADDSYISRTDGSIHEGEYIVESDANGFMASNKDPNPSRPEIVILGDSIVESLFVDQDERLYRVAQRALDHRGLDFRVLGGGVSGATSLHSLHVVTSKIIPMRPRITLIMNGVMDIECAIDEKSFWSKQFHLDPFSYGIINTNKDKIPVGANFEDRKRLLRLIAQTFREFEMDLYLATFLYRRWNDTDKFITTKYDRQRYAQVASLWEACNNVTRRVASEFSLQILDVDLRFAHRNDLLYDEYHLNQDGNAELGAWIGWQIADLMLDTKKNHSYKLIKRAIKKMRGARRRLV